jgi:hypothetical protein
VSGERYIARVPDAAARAIGGELMVMSGRDSSLFSLNETAAALWEAADGSTPLAQIVERHICAQYDVAPEEALRDAEEVVRALADHGILLVSERPIATP